VVATVAGGVAALLVHSAWSASERWRIHRRTHLAGPMERIDAAGH
jgi:hypothetical protein